MSKRISRRSALQSIAGVSIGLAILRSGSARTYAANEKLNIACIGVGGRGSSNVNARQLLPVSAAKRSGANSP